MSMFRQIAIFLATVFSTRIRFGRTVRKRRVSRYMLEIEETVSPATMAVVSDGRGKCVIQNVTKKSRCRRQAFPARDRFVKPHSECEIRITLYFR